MGVKVGDASSHTSGGAAGGSNPGGTSTDNRSLSNVSVKSVSPSGGSDIQLKKQVGLWSGVSLIVGTIIGSGIFISPQGVTANAGSVGLSLIIWFVCGIISLMGALSYAELGTSIPVSGGDYSYILFAYGDCLAFLMAWTYLLLLQPASLAIISLTCGNYLLTPLFDDGCGAPPDHLVKLVAILVILLLAAINCSSVEIAAKIQIIFTAAKVIALLIIIFGGVVWLAEGNPEYISTGFEGTESDISKIIMAFYSCMWSYMGWANLNYVTEEIEEPHKNLPRAILIGVPLVIVVYLLTNLSYYAALPVEEMVASSAVAVTWAEYVIPKVVWIIPLSVGLSTFGSVNGGLFVTGRLCFAAARNGHMLKVLSMVQVEKYTPFPSVVFTAILTMLFTIPGNVGSLLDLFNFVIWMIYSLTMFEVVWLRFTHKDMERPYKVWIWVPIVTFIVAVLLVLIPLVTDPQLQYLFAIGFIVLGGIVYVPVIYFTKHLPGMESFTMASQLFMKVAQPGSASKKPPGGPSAIEEEKQGHDNIGATYDDVKEMKDLSEKEDLDLETVKKDPDEATTADADGTQLGESQRL